MRAGLLREILVFSEQVSTTSATGAVKKTYQEILTCKAKKVNLNSSGDGVEAKEEFIGNVAIFQFRYNPAIKELQRVSWMGNKFTVKLLDPQPDNTYLATLIKINE